MNNETKELIEFLNNIKSKQEDGDKIAKIKNIINLRNSMDMKNGIPYLYDIIKDHEIEKYLKYREPQGNFNIFGQPITKEESFIQDCNAVIFAIAISIAEDKIIDKAKTQLRPNFKSDIEFIEFYKNIIKN